MKNLYAIYRGCFGTPLWVWALFVFLFHRGTTALKDRTMPFYKLFVVPMVLFILSVKGLLSSYGVNAYASTIWGSYILGGIIIGMILVRDLNILANKQTGWVKVPGNKTTLILITIIFFIKYCFGYVASIYPAQAQTVWFMTLRCAASGLISGILLGRLISYIVKYHNAPHTDF